MRRCGRAVKGFGGAALGGTIVRMGTAVVRGWAKSSLARGASEYLICSWPKMQLGIAMRVLRQAGGAYGSWQRGPKRPETDDPAYDVCLTTNISQNVLVHHHATRTQTCGRLDEGLNWKLKYRFHRHSHQLYMILPSMRPKPTSILARTPPINARTPTIPMHDLRLRVYFLVVKSVSRLEVPLSLERPQVQESVPNHQLSDPT